VRPSEEVHSFGCQLRRLRNRIHQPVDKGFRAGSNCANGHMAVQPRGPELPQPLTSSDITFACSAHPVLLTIPLETGVATTMVHEPTARLNRSILGSTETARPGHMLTSHDQVLVSLRIGLAD